MDDTRILVFDTQAGAADAVATIGRTMGLTGSTFLYAQPLGLVDGRWCIPYPSDDAWLVGVTGAVVAAGTGLIAIGEGMPGPVVGKIVPKSVTNFQARFVLRRMPSPTGVSGRVLFQDVDDHCREVSGDTWQAWEQANDFKRGGVLVQSLAKLLGLSDDQLDDLFVAAAGVEA